MSHYHVMKVASVVVLLSAAYTETVGCCQCLLWCGFARTDAILRVLQVKRSEHLEGPCRISGAIERLGCQHNSAVIHCLRAYLLLLFHCLHPAAASESQTEMSMFSLIKWFNVHRQVI